MTSSAGKRLIGKAIAELPVIKSTLCHGTIAIVAGTTNGYVAEEILKTLGEEKAFDRKRFFRGVTLPPEYEVTEAGRLPDESGFLGDVIIKDGVWQRGKTIGDVADELQEGDVIIKGANALDPLHKRAAVLVGHQQGGTTTIALQAVVGRRVRLILPVGLEKRIYGNLDEIARLLLIPASKGLRLLPVPGAIFTEIEALSSLAGVTAELVAAGGVCGAEGSIRLAYSGTGEAESLAEQIIQSVAFEPSFTIR
ncbi:MAG: hypothetical protein PHY18_01785 [Dehalococcoidales bacterium]|nr:hypothetical protein [Dehalococcoidales bacterium]